MSRERRRWRCGEEREGNEDDARMLHTRRWEQRRKLPARPSWGKVPICLRGLSRRLVPAYPHPLHPTCPESPPTGASPHCGPSDAASSVFISSRSLLLSFQILDTHLRQPVSACVWLYMTYPASMRPFDNPITSDELDSRDPAWSLASRVWTIAEDLRTRSIRINVASHGVAFTARPAPAS